MRATIVTLSDFPWIQIGSGRSEGKSLNLWSENKIIRLKYFPIRLVSPISRLTLDSGQKGGEFTLRQSKAGEVKMFRVDHNLSSFELRSEC